MDFATYLFSFIEGILSFISPCMLPMLPIYLFYLTGTSIESNAGQETSRTKFILNTIGFVIGFSIVFILMGATATTIGSFLKDNVVTLRYISGIVIFLFGLLFLLQGFLKISRIPFLHSDKRFEYNFKQLKLLSSIVFGIVFGLGWSPCYGPFLGSAIMRAANSDTLLGGTLLLAVYSLGMGLPFIIAAIAFEKAKDAFKAIQRYSRIINISSGILLMLGGALIFFKVL